MPKHKISTFSQELTPEEAEKEKALGTPIGKALKRADEEYAKRRKK